MRLTSEKEKKIREDQAAVLIPDKIVLALLYEIDALRAEYHSALDALTTTQEEWLLRTKSLEAQNYNLRQTIAVERHWQNLDKAKNE